MNKGKSTSQDTMVEAKAMERTMSTEAWRGNIATVTTASARMAMVSLGRVVVEVVVMVIDLYLANFVFFLQFVLLDFEE